MDSFPAFDCDWVVPIHDEDYLPFLINAVGKAKRRVLCSIFIVDPRFDYDPHLKVRSLISALEDAKTRNIDVRVILGDSITVEQIRLANRIALALLSSREISVRQTNLSRESTHSKLVVVDEGLTLLGSHNWSNEGLDKAREDSIAVYSADLARTFSLEFEQRWAMNNQEVI